MPGFRSGPHKWIDRITSLDLLAHFASSFGVAGSARVVRGKWRWLHKPMNLVEFAELGIDVLPVIFGKGRRRADRGWTPLLAFPASGGVGDRRGRQGEQNKDAYYLM